MITWRKITKRDYQDILVLWWEDHKWEAPILESLPEGYIVSKDGVDTYATFIYFTGTVIAWMEFTVCNPNATLELKKDCLEYLIQVVGTIAKDRGAKVIFTSTGQSFANALSGRGGFSVNDKNCVQLTKIL